MNRVDSQSKPSATPRLNGIREEFWLDRIEGVEEGGRVLVICGCLHCVPLSESDETRSQGVVEDILPRTSGCTEAGALLMSDDRVTIRGVTRAALGMRQHP